MCTVAITAEPLLVSELLLVSSSSPHRLHVFIVWILSLVQIVATAVCHTDLYHLLENMYEAGFPTVLGHEAAGIVESIGPGVTEFQPG